MKIMQLISSGGYYGAESMLLNLVEGLLARDCNVRVCVFENSQNPQLEIVDRLRAAGAMASVIVCNGRMDWGAMGRLAAYLASENPDILHTHGYKADIYGYFATRSLPIIRLSTCHNWTNASCALRVYGMLDKYFLRRYAHVVGVSMPIVMELQRSGVSPDRITLIDNGIAPGELRDGKSHENPKANIVIGMASRLVDEKGIPEFLHASARILQRFPETRFVIAGQGPCRATFEVEAAKLQIASRVDFVGHVQDMAAFYSSIDIFALPSHREGLPMSLLEAMGAGRAVVATNVGGIPKLITEGETGLLVNAGDVDSLSNAFSTLILDPALRRNMGQKARALIESSYSSSRMANQYLDLYKSLIAQQMAATV